LTLTLSEPPGHEVHTPPCFVQKPQLQARAGISDGSGFQSSVKEMLPQWQPPRISMVRGGLRRAAARPNGRVGRQARMR
jgi:hypothetical protein